MATEALPPTVRRAGLPLGVLALMALVSAVSLWGAGGRAPRAAAAALQQAAAPEKTSGATAGKIIFNRDIRPILSDRCFSCHGPDANKRQAGLRLDRPDAAMGSLPKHPKLKAFVPGDPEHSEALRRILSTDPVSIMPPPSSHLALTEKEKELVRDWVKQGGSYDEHWAFTAPVRQPAPAVKNAAWPKNDIDRFVLANLESRGLTPSKQADRPTLIRRASLDLTGIPPTPAEVDAFVADASPNAFEKVVDRLLASPRYGEQMAVQWLDYARYADSHGFQSDPERHMWKWRDWVIDAYNANMPFDEFTIEQLAGDLLPNPTMEQRIATGFNRNHRINDEGGIIGEEWRVEGAIDRVSTTSAVFMGLTMECCRCHDHKYDPITQKEFYQFSAYFNSVNEEGFGPTGETDKGINVPPILKFPSPEQRAQLDAIVVRSKALAAHIEEIKARVPQRVAALDAPGARLADPDGLLVRLPLNGTGGVSAVDGGGAAVASTFVGAGEPVFVDGKFGKAMRFDGGHAVSLGDAVRFERTDKFSYGAWIRRQGGGAILSRMDSADAFRGFDMYMDGDRVAVHIIHHWEDNALKVATRVAVPMDAWTHVLVTYDGSSRAAGVKIYLNGAPAPLQVDRDALKDTIETKSPTLIGGRSGSDAFHGDVYDARFYGRALAPWEAAAVARGEEARNALAVAADTRTPQQKQAIERFAESTDPDLAGALQDVLAVKAERAAVEALVPDTMVMEERNEPRETFVLERGQYDKHGEKVGPGVPAVLPPLPKDAPPNRLGMARWIVDPGNPLTARVQVNRFWEKFFGVGLVKTSENFGVQTEWPSNPELLDWLATEFVRLHWDMKALQKEIVMSAAYQQASDVTPEMVEMDPEDRLIERGPRFRLGAEQVRDQALAVSGLLVEKIGGPSSRPYQPADLWAGNSFGNLAVYVPDKGEGLYRRSLYTFIKRSAVPANLSLFDQPSREYCVIRRSRTDTPLQALNLMNDPTYLEASRVLAERVMTYVPGAPASRIAAAFKRVTCRQPTEAELKILVAGFGENLARFQRSPEDAAKFLDVGTTPRNPKCDVPELAAYTVTCSIMLNLDEVVTHQ